MANTTINTPNKLHDNDDANTLGFDRKELKKIAKNTGASIRSFINEKSHQADELRIKGEEAVKTHPYTAIAAATVGGILLGALLRRK